MRRASSERLRFSGQRGFWLRCFLGAGILAILVSTDCGMAYAQLDTPGPMHLWHLHGVVVDGAGRPVAGEAVNLVRNDKVEYATKTDAAGRFEFKKVSGRYWLQMHPRNASIVSREVDVGDEAMMVLKKRAFYVILGPRQCTDDCSQVFVSKGDFDKAVKRDTQHHY